jgi:hypothetical protein
VSFTSDDSGSYYYDMYFHQQSLFASVLDRGDAATTRSLITGGVENTTLPGK